MASAAKEYRYAHREFSTQGNLARDLDWAVREPPKSVGSRRWSGSGSPFLY